MIYNKFSEYYIKNNIKDEDRKLLENALMEFIKYENKKVIKISHIWNCLYMNENLRNKYNILFKENPIKLIDHTVKTYNYSKKKLIKILLEYNIDTDFETKELLLNILYLCAKLTCEDNSLNLSSPDNDKLLDTYIYKFIGINLKDLSYTNKYNLFQDIILNFILIELYLANYKKINVLQFIKFINDISNEDFKDIYTRINKLNNK